MFSSYYKSEIHLKTRQIAQQKRSIQVNKSDQPTKSNGFPGCGITVGPDGRTLFSYLSAN